MSLIDINNVKLTYKYLNMIYELTKNDYISEKYIISEDHKGHNLKSLLQHNMLTESNGRYKWNVGKPFYAQSYDYYNVVKNRKRRYGHLLIILEFPDKASAADIFEAIAVRDLQELSIKVDKEVENLHATIMKKIEPKTGENLASFIDIVDVEFKTNIKEKPETVLLSEKQENKILLQEIINRLDKQDNDKKMIIELLTNMTKSVMENTEATRSNQNSLSMAIAVLKTNQINLFDLVAVQYNLLKDLVANYPFTDDPKDVERKKSMCDILLYIKKRVDSNTNLINKYSR